MILQNILVLGLILAIGITNGSHYRGGTISYTIMKDPADNSTVSVRISQRHSWRRSAHFCNDTSIERQPLIGEGFLNPNSTDSRLISQIDARVRCTDFNEAFDYSSGEDSIVRLMPVNEYIEYVYSDCCWIRLLPPNAGDRWSLKVTINTTARPTGDFNNSPRTTMNPIVQVEVGQTHLIRIPMADTDGDTVRCRWGIDESECGSICAEKGYLRADPCELLYNATQVGYQAVGLVIEDFDSDNKVLSSVPLQFLIHIVDKINNSNCLKSPEYIGEWPADSCIGIRSNVTTQGRIQVRIPCENTTTTLRDILTISPIGFEKGLIQRDPYDSQLYSMSFTWAPGPDQYGVQQACFTPVDSDRRTGSQVCLNFEVDTNPPQLINVHPQGVVFANQSQWTITMDQTISPPRRINGPYVRFYRKSDHVLVYQVDLTNNPTVDYDERSITFFTADTTWEEGEHYYILIDAGVAIINQSCGVESLPVINQNIWTFEVLRDTTSAMPISTTAVTRTSNTAVPTTESIGTDCPRWLPFKTVSNETTDVDHPEFVFCFYAELLITDVTIAANTWVSCMEWKNSGSADPLMELYSLPNGQLLAENDDGNSLSHSNCFASVLSYRLPRGAYRVVIRHPKCSYGKFELRLSAEIN